MNARLLCWLARVVPRARRRDWLHEWRAELAHQRGSHRRMARAIWTAALEDVAIFKPHASVYQQVLDRMALEPRNVCFLSSNAWDACGAAHLGFQVLWINRAGMPRERLPGTLAGEVTSLAELPAWLAL